MLELTGSGSEIVYEPLPIAQFRTTHLSAKHDDALRFNRDRMLELLELLTQRMPASPDAFEAMDSSQSPTRE